MTNIKTAGWTSYDDMITLPVEVQIEHDRVIACYDGAEDVEYPTWDAFATAHRLDPDSYDLPDGTRLPGGHYVDTAAK